MTGGSPAERDPPRVPFVDLRARVAALRDELDAAVRRVLDSGWFVLGPEVEGFEREFAEALGASEAVAVASGTEALQLALTAVGAGPGDEVVTTSLSAAFTGLAVLASGARPVFVDVDPETLNLDPAAVARAVTPRTKALLPVHLYGHPADMEPILDVAREHALAVVEDACQAHGALYRGRPVGTLGGERGIGALSFYPTKNLGALGDGGALLSERPQARRPPPATAQRRPVRPLPARGARSQQPARRAAGGDPSRGAPAPRGLERAAPGSRRVLPAVPRGHGPRPSRRETGRPLRRSPLRGPPSETRRPHGRAARAGRGDAHPLPDPAAPPARLRRPRRRAGPPARRREGGERDRFPAALSGSSPTPRPRRSPPPSARRSSRSNSASILGRMSHHGQLLERIAGRTAQVGVIGLGYVGLPLALLFEEARFPGHRVRRRPGQARGPLPRRESYIRHIGRGAGRRAPSPAAGSRPPPTSAGCADCDAILDLRADAARRSTASPTSPSSAATARRDRAAPARTGQLVVLESTTYPGTTDEEVLPMPRGRAGSACGGGLLPRLLAGARRSRQPALLDAEHPEGGGRRRCAVQRGWRPRSTAPSSRGRGGLVAARSPSLRSSSRTSSAP